MEAAHGITLELSFARRKALVFLTLFFLCWRPGSLGSETLTMTTYYPAPYGGYARLLTTGETLLARDGGNVGIGTNAPAVKLDVRGGGINVTGGGINVTGGGINVTGGNFHFTENGRTISAAGRMHVYGTELLYLLNTNGVVIGREWGGSGNLSVQGTLSGVCANARINNTGWTNCPAGTSVFNVGYDNWTTEWACIGNYQNTCAAGAKLVGTTGWLRCCRIQ